MKIYHPMVILIESLHPMVILIESLVTLSIIIFLFIDMLIKRHKYNKFKQIKKGVDAIIRDEELMRILDIKKGYFRSEPNEEGKIK